MSHSKVYFIRDFGLLNVGESICIDGTELQKLTPCLFDLLLSVGVED